MSRPPTVYEVHQQVKSLVRHNIEVGTEENRHEGGQYE